MAQQGILFHVTHPDTLTAAWKRVRTKGAAGGSDGVTVDSFAKDAQARLAELRRELLDETYVPEPLQEITIPKENKPKEKRTLLLPSVRDKVVQEAVRTSIEPLLERRFLDCSYGYRPGKGPQRAVARVSDYLVHRKKRWVVTADIDDFFGSMNQEWLVDGLRAVLHDEAVLRLIRLFLRMGAVDGRGRWRDVYSGVGQGGVVSPLLANFYLHPFDESLTSQGCGLVRYADDFVILCGERAEAEMALERATHFLRERLRYCQMLWIGMIRQRSPRAAHRAVNDRPAPLELHP